MRRGHHDGALGTVPRDESARRVVVDDAAVLDDRDVVTQPLGLLHQMGRQEDRLAALANVADQVPDRPPCLRVESGGQLIEEDQFRVVDERQCDEQPLLLAAREGHEPGVSLLGEPQLVEEPVAVDRPGIERRPEVDRFPDLNPFLQLRLLELHADPVLQGAGVPRGVEPEDLDPAAVRPSQPLGALHRRRLAGAVRADQSEDFTRLHLERHIINGDGLAVGLPDAGDTHHGNTHARAILFVSLAAVVDTGGATVCNGVALGSAQGWGPFLGPGWQDPRREHTGSVRLTRNAARRNGSAAPNRNLFLRGPLEEA
uniref:Uncharacterized protein n=1 Tax=uncultured marine microorganism HF4000_009L19 TaxID=455516 RepID=B3T1F4_9ZZZZ|nr:hypothetical protein ALOHA_HF4000009L19ctg1g10 [uncultured marine microorganism HF4000_009L19]